MTCARWLTLTAAATCLNLPVEEVQRLVDAKVLYAEWLHRDHWVISEASVDALLAQRAGDDPDRPVPVRGGPPLDPQTEFEYIREREK